MLALTTWILTTTFLLTPTVETEASTWIDVNCDSPRILKRLLANAEHFGDVDIVLHGVCQGHYVIAANGVTLRGATNDSGLAAPAGDSSSVPVLEVVDAQASLRGLVVQGGEVGVFIHGWNAEALLVEVDVHGQENGVGVVASRGAKVTVFDSTIRDGFLGILAQSDSEINLQNVIVNNLNEGVIAVDESYAHLANTTVENNRSVGLHLDDRSDATVGGSVFRENGDVHLFVKDRSSLKIWSESVVGSETDTTLYALVADGDSAIASFVTPAIYGIVHAWDSGSIRLGNTMIDGDLIVAQFSDVHVRNLEITGSVLCSEGGDAICGHATIGGIVYCPSTSCGLVTAEAHGKTPSVPEPPVVEVPSVKRLRR